MYFERNLIDDGFDYNRCQDNADFLLTATNSYMSSSRKKVEINRTRLATST